MVHHIVMWKFQEKDKQENIKRAKQLLESLVPVIPQIKSLSLGKNFNPSDAAFDTVLVTTFDCAEDLEIYQNHPAHREAAKFITSVRTAHAVVDYTDETVCTK